MKRPILSMLLSVLLLLPGCTQAPSGSSQEEGLTVLATTYPVYLLASAVAENVDGVVVERLNTGEVSCLHDYTLTVSDMKLIESADVIAMNGAGLENFMDDALSQAQGAVIDCSQGVQMLEMVGHDHHDGDEEDGEHYDPHIWMDPENAMIMAENIQKGLSQADPDHAQTYSDNLTEALALLNSWDSNLQEMIQEAEQKGGVPRPLTCLFWPPLKRRKAARPALRSSMRRSLW